MYERSEIPTALPIYVQISEVLIREVASGRLVDGQRLPPERDLAKQHNTSVRTLRKALKILEQSGLVERRQGSGNYVCSTPHVSSIYSMFRLELHTGGGLPTAKVFSIEEMEKPKDLVTFGTSSHATRIRRLRFIDGVPIAIEEIWLDRDAGKVEADLVSDSLYRYYKMQLGFWISRAEDNVSVGKVPSWSPSQFPLPSDSISGFIERLSWARGKLPIEYSKTWFDPQTAHYMQRFI